MSVFADERATILGKPSDGSTPAYTLSSDQRLRVETITFTLATGAAGHTHYAVVNYLDQSGAILSSIQDLFDVADSLTVFYTFGIGLTASCGTAAGGLTIQNDLPDTVLEGSSAIQLFTVDETGAGISGDAFTDIVIYGARDTGGGAPDVIPLLTPIALSEQVSEGVAAVSGLLG